MLTCPSISKTLTNMRPSDYLGKGGINKPIPSVTDRQAYPGISQPGAGVTRPFPSPIPAPESLVLMDGTPEGVLGDPSSSQQIPICDIGVTQPGAYRIFVEKNSTHRQGIW